MNQNQRSWQDAVFHWWADRTIVQIVVLVCISAFAILGYVDPKLPQRLTETAYRDSEANSPVPITLVAQAGGDAQTQPAPETNTNDSSQAGNEPSDAGDLGGNDTSTEFSVGNGECIMVVRLRQPTDAGFFTGPNLSAVYRVVEKLRSMPQIDRVTWMRNVPDFNIFGLTGTSVPRPNASPRQMLAAQKRVLENPLMVGQLISPNGKTLLIHLQFDWFHVDSDAAVTDEIRDAANEAIAGVEGVSMQVQLTGSVPLHLMLVQQQHTNSLKYQLIGYSIMVIAALVLFRGFSAVVIVALSPAVGVFWTMGFLRFFDLQYNPFTDVIVPVLISLVGLTDAVHLMVEIRTQRSSGMSTQRAARIGIRRVGMACLLTSLTTAIGFVSLTTAHHESVQEFGWCCVMGVLLTFISVLTVTPLGCRSWLGRRLHVGMKNSMIDQQLKRLGPIVQWVIRHSRSMSMLAIGST
ncbi:MAG: MMPL family transporter, partial [Planctomycetota bacterium]